MDVGADGVSLFRVSRNDAVATEWRARADSVPDVASVVPVEAAVGARVAVQTRSHALAASPLILLASLNYSRWGAKRDPEIH